MSRQYAKSEHTLHNSQCTATWVIPTWNAQKGGLHAHTSYKWLAFVKKRGRNSDAEEGMHLKQCDCQGQGEGGSMPFILNTVHVKNQETHAMPHQIQKASFPRQPGPSVPKLSEHTDNNYNIHQKKSIILDPDTK